MNKLYLNKMRNWCFDNALMLGSTDLTKTVMIEMLPKYVELNKFKTVEITPEDIQNASGETVCGVPFMYLFGAGVYFETAPSFWRKIVTSKDEWDAYDSLIKSLACDEVLADSDTIGDNFPQFLRVYGQDLLSKAYMNSVDVNNLECESLSKLIDSLNVVTKDDVVEITESDIQSEDFIIKGVPRSYIVYAGKYVSVQDTWRLVVKDEKEFIDYYNKITNNFEGVYYMHMLTEIYGSSFIERFFLDNPNISPNADVCVILMKLAGYIESNIGSRFFIGKDFCDKIRSDKHFGKRYPEVDVPGIYYFVQSHLLRPIISDYGRLCDYYAFLCKSS